MSTAYESLVSGLSPSVWFKFDGTTNPPTNSGYDSTPAITTTTGTPTLNNYSDISNQCVYFDGNAGYQVTGSRTAGVLSDNVFSIEFWFKAGSTGTYHTFFNLIDSANGGWMNLRAGSAGNIEFNYIASTGKKFVELKSPATTYLDNQWHHVVAVRNSTNIYLYVDGAQRATDTYQSGQTFGSTADTGAFQIARREGSVGERLTGYLDELAIYPQALTASQINANFVEGSAFYYYDTPKTASALLPMPAITASSINSAAVMTASSLMGNTQVSNFDNSSPLSTWLPTLNLETYYKFDKNLANSGDGGNTVWYIISGQEYFETGGPSNLPYIHLNNYMTTTIGYATQQPFWTGAITDDDFVLGLWFRKSASGAFDLVRFSNNAETAMALKMGINSSGYLTATYTTSAASLTLTGSTNLLDGQWHFVAMSYKQSNSVFKIYENGSFTATGTLTGDCPGFPYAEIGTNADIAALIVDNNTVLTESALDAIHLRGSSFYQAAAFMPQDVKVKISTSFYNYMESLGTPTTELKLDNTGLPNDNGSSQMAWTLSGDSADIYPQQVSKSVYSYKFTDKESFYLTLGSSDYSNDQISAVALFKVNPTLMQDNTSSSYGVRNIIYQPPLYTLGGFTLGVGEDNYYLYIAPGDYSQEVFVETDALTLDDKWHLLAATKNGTALKLYLDGKLVKSHTLSTNIPMASGPGYGFIGGNEPSWFGQTAGATEKYIDYVASYNDVFTAAEMFEMWQAVGNDAMNASSAFPVPANVAGFGPTIHPGVMYVSALLVDPTQQDTVAPTIVPATAFATFTMPNFGTETFIQANYSASAMTASALFHIPQYSIGEINGVDHMNASAEMGNHRFTSQGIVPGNPFVATNANLPMPGFVTVKGARIEAPALTARAFFALPPAYVQLTDDPYFVRLYGVHSQKTNEAAQSFGGAGIATAATTSVAKSFLKFFNDVNADITLGSTNYLTNEMPNYVYDPIGAVYTDENGDIVPPDSTKRQITSRSGRGSITPTPILSKGYFDAWDRKAVNLTNIEFNFGTDSQYHSLRGYSVEFTIKTTKSNQVLTYGEWQSFYYNQRAIGTIGLFDGKLYSMRSFQPIGGAAVIPHPTNIDELTRKQLENGYMAGNKRIDDGQWHHIVIQFGFIDNRTQYWIDGELDRQLIDKGSAPGANGYCDIRPYTLGFNNDNIKLASDFQTSVWSWTPNKFLEERDIKLNYEAAYKYDPIFAEPMLATVSPTQDHKAEGNRGRALMLYWWPTNTDQRRGGYLPTFNQSGLPFDGETFDPSLDTVDYATVGPQEYEGWDIFPVDVTGYFVSDLVKPEAYGGIENIRYGNGGGHILTRAGFGPEWKFNARQTFRNSITDAPRYLDLVNDIDLSQFDAITFKNFPDQTNEIEAYANQEVVDAYFGIRELKIYEDFIKSLRAAVDSGISLYVTNTELAIDLGIIDRVEIVPDMNDLVGFDSDPYSPTVVPDDAATLPVSDGTTVNVWEDTYRNNNQRLVNTVYGMTDFPTVIKVEEAKWRNDDQIRWAGADRYFSRLVIKPNGLSVGDEWKINANGPNYQAVPFANIKAGKPVTAFANQVRRGLDLIDNPYKNHAISIIVEKGDRLNGSICGGKIFVNFTEAFDGEEFGVDLLQDTLINYAEQEEIISSTFATTLRNSGTNYDRRLASGALTQTAYNKLARWTSNGMYVLQQNTPFADDSDSPKGGGIVTVRTPKIRKISKNNKISFQSQGQGGIWFSSEYSWQYPRATFFVPSMITRGFWWISNRELPTGTVVGAPVMTASVTSGQAAARPDKIINISSNAMIANARIVDGSGYAPSGSTYPSLPMTANAIMNDKVFKIDAAPILVSANMPQNTRALTSSIDEVIVYIMHEDAILYLREEVIK